MELFFPFPQEIFLSLFSFFNPKEIDANDACFRVIYGFKNIASIVPKLSD